VEDRPFVALHSGFEKENDMRYLLVIVGCLGLLVGLQHQSSPPPFQTFGAAYLVAGAVFFAIGGGDI
jgi:hypothetical protein